MEIKKLFKGAHCPKCGNRFDFDDINIMRNEDGLIVFQLKCEKCEKGFGLALFGLGEDEIGNSFLGESIKGEDDTNSCCTNSKEPPAINIDDVLDAHKFFKNSDENWKKFMMKRKN